MYANQCGIITQTHTHTHIHTHASIGWCPYQSCRREKFSLRNKIESKNDRILKYFEYFLELNGYVYHNIFACDFFTVIDFNLHAAYATTTT